MFALFGCPFSVLVRHQSRLRKYVLHGKFYGNLFLRHARLWIKWTQQTSIYTIECFTA